jgi:hypothetical protein
MLTSQFTISQKVYGYAISWGDYAYHVLGFTESIVSPFSEENVNSASYCEVLLMLGDAVLKKLPGKLAKAVLLHHDNATPHTAWATWKRLQELLWELLEHPP